MFATGQPTQRYRVKELAEGTTASARTAAVDAVGPLQAALAAWSGWVATPANPYAIHVERQIERTVTVVIEWTTGELSVRRRYVVKPVS